jgi:hypothetical protein
MVFLIGLMWKVEDYTLYGFRRYRILRLVDIVADEEFDVRGALHAGTPESNTSFATLAAVSVLRTFDCVESNKPCFAN